MAKNTYFPKGFITIEDKLYDRPDMVELRGEFGLEGYGLYMYLIQTACSVYGITNDSEENPYYGVLSYSYMRTIALMNNCSEENFKRIFTFLKDNGLLMEVPLSDTKSRWMVFYADKHIKSSRDQHFQKVESGKKGQEAKRSKKKTQEEDNPDEVDGEVSF